MKEGPSIHEIPSQSERICNGCKFLDRHAMLRGHKENTDSYACTHPDFIGEDQLMSRRPGRTIHFNHRGNCDTPDWCPFLKQKP